MQILEQEAENVKALQVVVPDIRAFTKAVHAAFPEWQAVRKVQMAAKNKSTVVLRAVCGYTFTADDLTLIGQIETPAEVATADVSDSPSFGIEIPWYGRNGKQLPTKRDRSRNRRSFGLRMGRGSAWAGVK